MLVNDIVLKARRILGDTDKQRWTDARLLDIVNAGLRDINKFAGAYRSEAFFELGSYRRRYPLPLDTIKVTSLAYDNLEVDIRNYTDTVPGFHAVKDQLNRGVIELRNMPDIPNRSPRFKQGPTGDLIPQPINDIWENDRWNDAGFWRDEQLWGSHFFDTQGGLGVVSNPLLNGVEGVTAGAAVGDGLYDNLPNTAFGLLSDIYIRGDGAVIPTEGDLFGVLTDFNTALTPNRDSSLGAIGTVINKPFRIAGKYGTVVSVLKPKEYLQVRYKALPQEVVTLEVAFPLSQTWIEPMLNWIVGTALQDDNDANNMARAQVFLGRYTRELEQEIRESSEDYSYASKKYEVKYNGGIR